MAKYKIIPSSRTIVQLPISIGHKAEKGVEAIEFDLTAWVETYGSGTLTVIMRRWGDAIPYPIALEIDENNKATWTLSSIDTAKAGMAYAQLSYIVGDEVVKKSDIYTFRVMDSLTGEGEPPEAYESWLEQLTHIAAEAMAEVLDIEGIVTDKTLTVDGGIADGKATGDALALKADKSTTYTKSEVDTLIKSVDVETDTTLSVSGKAADAKTVGDELGAINESLDDVKADLADTQVVFNQNLDSIRTAFPVSTNLFNVDNPNILVGKYLTNTGNSGMYQNVNTSYFIPVEPSTEYCIACDQDNYPRYITEYDSTKTVIQNSGASYANITTTPNTAYIRFTYDNRKTHWRMTVGSTKQPYEPYYYDYIKTDDTLTDKDLPANAKAVGDMFESAGFSNETYVADDILSLTFVDGYVAKNGETSSSQTLHYSNRISVKGGDVLYLDETSSFRFVCAYNGNGSAVFASGAENVKRYTVPSGIVEVVLTLYKSHTGVVRHVHEESVFVQSNRQLGYFRATGNLADGDTLTLPVTNVNKNVRQVFTADITSFGSLLIGRKNGNKGYWVVIDSTNITVYRDNVASDAVPHGLIIQNNIQVKIITHNDLSTPGDLYNADITVTSNGESFTVQNIDWVRTYNTPIVQSIGSTLADCVMSWESGDINKAIYMFGDSYFSWYAERWTSYCAKDGFANNALFNAYAGENTANAIIALRNIVPMGKPKYIVWCLGMNDGSDTSSLPSPSWVTGKDAVINICKRYGITPIFATIPTVQSINNEQKNAWVRSSGYRYIDFAKAVGADASGNWYSGMIAGDNVHPSVQGAKALYGRVLTDFPEIMVNN